MTETPRRLVAEEIDELASLARLVWQATYPGLISQAQIDYMLADRYAPARIHAQIHDPAHAWRVVGTPVVGFAHAFLADGCAKLDKLYVHPAQQRRGHGTALMTAVTEWARVQGASTLRLQVNRGNHPAIRAYERYGFRIIESRVFDIGQGFVMDDHVMEITL